MTTTTQTQPHLLWDLIKGDFQSIFPQDVYRTWFEPMECIEEDEDCLTLSVPNEFAAIWIQDNYLDLITRRVQMAAGRGMSVNFSVKTAQAQPTEMIQNNIKQTNPELDAQHRPSVRSSKSVSCILNPRNTFENFVVGLGNQLAHAACIAVANTPGRAYNPLFLYGETGLGKTHLMHATAHHILNTRPQAQIAYISTEKFTNEFIRAIQENSLIKFRQRYRSVDILLIDDIHFLSGKERIQEEFFHTFNELFESGKQIVLSSDRPASEIAKLESRLISRFQWGLVTDIQAPDFETRMAILSKKAIAMKLHLPPAILQFLAERVSRNVRRMEGALTRVGGYVALTNGTIDIPQVERLLHDILQEEVQNQLTIEKIQQKVCDHYQLRMADLTGKRRPANIALPRQVAMYISRMLTSHSLQEIGEAFGGRDHGTVIHACKTVENMMDQDANIKRNVEYLQNQLSCNR